MLLSTGSNYSIEEVAEVATGPVWLQLSHTEAQLSEMLVHRAEEAGFKAVCLTVDTPVPVPQERSVKNRYDHPFERGNFRGMDVQTGATVSPTGDPFAWRPQAAPLTWKEVGLAPLFDSSANSIEGDKRPRGRAAGCGTRRKRHLGVQPRWPAN